MSGLRAGALITKTWGPLRTEIERILADGAWHEYEVLFWQVERFVDPRVAAREWTRMYDRNTKYYGLERGPASQAFTECERAALKVGRRRVFWDTLRGTIERGHIQLDTWNGRRRVRLRPQE